MVAQPSWPNHNFHLLSMTLHTRHRLKGFPSHLFPLINLELKQKILVLNVTAELLIVACSFVIQRATDCNFCSSKCVLTLSLSAI